MTKDIPPVREGAVVACVALGAFLFQFEAFVVNVSLPTIAHELGTSTTFVSFVVIAYLLAATTAFLPAGRIADRVGLKRIFLLGCGLAAVGTTVSGLAPNLWLLCAGRLTQGLGAGAMIALGYGMIPAWVAPERTGWGYGWVSLGAASGMVAGLPVGGLLIAFAPWRWIFLVTVPVLLALLAFGWRVLPGAPPRTAAKQPIDPLGSAAFAATIAGAVLAISLGDELGWSSRPVALMVLMAVAAGALLAFRARLTGRAYLPVDALRAPGFIAGLGVLFVFAMMSAGIQFLLPFYLKLAGGLSALQSSVLLLVFPLLLAPTGAWAGRAADRLGSRTLVWAGTGLGAMASLGFCVQLHHPQLWLPAIYLAALGLASGLFYAPNNRYIMNCGAQHHVAEAGSLLPIALNLGSLMGVSLFDTVFSQPLPGGVADVDALVAAGSAAMPMLNKGFELAYALASAGMFGCAWAARKLYRGTDDKD